MVAEFTTLGAMAGLVIAIILIVKKVHPMYALVLGALVGGLIGGGDLPTIVSTMIKGSEGMMSSVLRILTSGVLAGMLIQTGSAEKIADVIVQKLGEQRAFIALAAAAMIICAVGVFINVAVITVAPIALVIGRKAGFHKSSILLAMIGGSKAGNIISPNSNTIAASQAFGVDLTALMLENVIPAIFALVVTVVLSIMIERRGKTPILEDDLDRRESDRLPSFGAAILGPLVVIIMMALGPMIGITIDPLFALPLGGIICCLATGNVRNMLSYAEFGLSKVVPVSILLIGTGTMAGIIKASALQTDVIQILEMLHMPAYVLAPLSGILMGGATASTTAGATIASETFSEVLLNGGVPALSAAAMIHAGSIVIDSLPHGSFFHATSDCVNMGFKERASLIVYEAIIGLSATLLAVVIYLIKVH